MTTQLKSLDFFVKVIKIDAIFDNLLLYFKKRFNYNELWVFAKFKTTGWYQSGTELVI